MLQILELGSICITNSWVTHTIFKENNNKKNLVIAYINCKTSLLYVLRLHLYFYRYWGILNVLYINFHSKLYEITWLMS